MASEDQELRAIVQRMSPKDRTSKLGEVLERFMAEALSPKFKAFTAVEQAWREAVPEELASHCRCEGVSNGQLKILVDSPAYMYRLETIRPQLFEQLGRLCPKPKIKKLKFIIAAFKQDQMEQ